jgi:hypothetical protein
VIPVTPRRPFRVLANIRRLQAYQIDAQLRSMYSMFCLFESLRLLLSIKFVGFQLFDARDPIFLCFSIAVFLMFRQIETKSYVGLGACLGFILLNASIVSRNLCDALSCASMNDGRSLKATYSVLRIYWGWVSLSVFVKEMFDIYVDCDP